jgi:hypothetical protein
MGRPLPVSDVGYPVAQRNGQLSGGEIARRTGAGRPKADISSASLLAAALEPKLVESVSKHMEH